jgi:hypothetical protein
MDYLEEEFSETEGYSLLPTTPLERCKMKMLIIRLADPMLPLLIKFIREREMPVIKIFNNYNSIYKDRESSLRKC